MGGRTSSALILQRMSVLDAGKKRREEALERMGEQQEEEEEGMRSVYGL